LVDNILSEHRVRLEPRIDEILAADREAREKARTIIEGIKH
jgi:hypothetical protein